MQQWQPQAVGAYAIIEKRIHAALSQICVSELKASKYAYALDITTCDLRVVIKSFIMSSNVRSVLLL